MFHDRRQLLIAFNAMLMVGAPAHAQLRGSADGKPQDHVFDKPVASDPESTESTIPESVLSGSVNIERAPISSATDLDIPAGETFRVGSVLIETTSNIDHAKFDRVIEPFLGTMVSNEDLASLAQEIADVARAEGMVLVNAYVPPQQIELGIVRVVLTIGAIDEIRYEGSDNRALRAILQPLVGKIVVQEDLERRLMLANDLPAITIDGAEFINESGKRILVVRVTERPETGGQIAVDNTGSHVVGPLRGRIRLDKIALLNASDAFSATVQTNPVDPSELLAGSIAYNIGLNSRGTRASAFVANSRSLIPGNLDFSRREITSRYVSAAVNHPLRRLRGSSAWMEGQIEYLEVEQQTPDALIASDTVVTLSASISSSLKLFDGWMRSGVQVRQGLGVLGANERGDILSSRNDASGEFSSARAWVNWYGKPVGDMTLRLALSGQLSNDPLLVSEELTLGGAYLGRGFEPYVLSGDQGFTAFAELGYEFIEPYAWLDRLQPYAFVDGGSVDQTGANYGGGGLISSGGGLRAEFGRLGLQLETAAPVHWNGEYEAKDTSRINFQIGLDF